MTDNELKVFTNYLEKKFHISTDKNSYQQTSRDIVDAILELTRYTRESQIPSMAGNSGKFLTNNGTTASWGTLVIPPSIDKYLKTDADLNATTQLVKDALGTSSRFKLGTTRATFFGNDFTGMGVSFKPSWVLANADVEQFGIAGGINSGSYGLFQGYDNNGSQAYRFHLQPFGGELGIGPNVFSNTKLSITGLGNTDATYAEEIVNSSNINLWKVRNDGRLTFGNTGGAGDFHIKAQGNYVGFGIEAANHNIGFPGVVISRDAAGYGVGLGHSMLPNVFADTTLSITGKYSGSGASNLIRGTDSSNVEVFKVTDLGHIYGGSIRTPTANHGFINNADNSVTAMYIANVTGDIGVQGSPITSSLFSIHSTTKGFRSPLMTTAQFAAIASKAQGLEAYSSNDAGKLWYDGSRTIGFRYNGTAFQGYNGTSWANMATSLQYWTESYNTYGGQKSSVFTVLGADTHINATVKPKGNGAFTTSDADGTTNGGNLRGSNSVDLQMVRGVATDVASGAWSTLLGGQENRASGALSVVGGGNINRATGLYSSILGGLWCEAYLYNQEARGNGSFGIAGDSQKSSIQLKRIGSGKNAGDNTELFLDGISIVAVPNGNNRAWNVTIKTTAVCTAVGSGSGVVGDTYTSTYTVGFKRVGGVVSIVSAATLVSSSADAGMAGALMVITAGASNNIKIEWQAPTSASGSTFRILSAVDLVEIAW